MKADRESEADRAKASAALWEARLEVTEISRAEYREAARLLAKNTEDLAWQQRRVEKDTVEVISFLKKQDVEKDKQVRAGLWAALDNVLHQLPALLRLIVLSCSSPQAHGVNIQQGQKELLTPLQPFASVSWPEVPSLMAHAQFFPQQSFLYHPVE